jgi:hypothetical protein
MGHGPLAFTEADVKRAVGALMKAGVPVAGVRFDRDRRGFTVLVGAANDQTLQEVSDKDVDNWLKKHAN